MPAKMELPAMPAVMLEAKPQNSSAHANTAVASSPSNGRISAEARATAGIGDGLLRIAVGLEDIDDLKADLARGLAS